MEKYRKEEIRRKNKVKVRKITKEQLEELLGQGRKECKTRRNFIHLLIFFFELGEGMHHERGLRLYQVHLMA